MTDRFFIFGAGYSCKAFARANIGSAKIVGTTRSQAKFGELERAGIEPLLFDGTTASIEILENLAGTTHLIVSIAPGDDGDPVLNTLRETIMEKMPALSWIGYLSTVGVYGDHQGRWVDETSACKPVSRRSVARLEAERAWQTLGEEVGVPLAILRLSGIYGPGRNAFVNLTNGTAKRLIKKDQVFNRIHVEDIAGALWLLAEQKTGGIFNVTDNEPAPPQDVVAFAAELMGIEPPPEQPFETAQISPMARSFYGENKRVANAKLRATGYQLRYPDYQASHRAMWNAGTWRGESEADARSTIRKG
ncbi:MAG TPA: SDR family oxidoreductase [Rhizobiaceae bacterium]|nr:SDR family oxidoreductase [Rhizobiaceae bacterium]